MKITIFAKKKLTREGKPFFTYLATIKKAGEPVTVSVKFTEEAGHPKPEECPVNIEFAKNDANLATRKVTVDRDGVPVVNEYLTMWIDSWEYSADKYVDHSMDDISE